ncbi:MAG TPA: hypothetical protein DD624_08015 [Alphaproteobacteria bacterium]|nr:hypothetical protein [Alphaproteobacteria bacterium]
MTNKLTLSPLPHTWIFDVDGTVCVHNGYKNGGDVLLDGVKELFAQIPPEDMIVFITSRKAEEKENLEAFLTENGLRFDHIIYDAPMGERILINDDKPSGLPMAFAVRKKRDATLDLAVMIDGSL